MASPVSTAVRYAFQQFSGRAQARRRALFQDAFPLDEHTTLVDVGGAGGSHAARLIEGTPIRPANVTLCDIDRDKVEAGAREYGFNAAVLEEGEPLPFPDDTFDIVYSNSVIEHVTIPKSQMWEMKSGRAFRAAALEAQGHFASELRRISKGGYWVQTPHRHFPIESHTWLPLVGSLPRRIQVPLMATTNRFWVKETGPDWYLLDAREMRQLFPDAELRQVRIAGMVRSLIAVGAIAR